ncbi:exodeoxyribonuclease VII large subunit [Dysgonomonas sp. 520]|uniref:exodeoxyribonuclease VII large subunit n=1 Tax=Dysgonomonas sp. 520 TaxID=2302931 RepID=UPI0013CF7ADF|nr:exodeoxyribonuclease VII large subunit [Dysgonomonas sp. 520]NDW08789.1 exodeoxyribonuclease VII large subunit [Dysgonomonas sp. 520]
MDSGRAISLYELNNRVRGVLKDGLPPYFWIVAETSDVRENQNGHCYLEFIEKDSSNRNIIAKSRASIWANNYKLLKAFFEHETGQRFVSGLKVMVQVSVEFHELYGYSLNVQNIDPSYTLGDQARNRALIIQQLQEDGVLYLNKELELPELLNKIAIISSPTAAGYEDFCNQIENNPQGYVFYTKLFPAVMQGERTENSIIDALERIYQYQDFFDAVVIIRGGGATSELSYFDSYLLAASCAQFPLPIITGIGHERDDTVLDVVAHTRAKTPTAVAEFLITKMDETADELLYLQQEIMSLVSQRIVDEYAYLNGVATHLSYQLKEKIKDKLNSVDSISERLKHATNSLIKEKKHYLEIKEQHLKLISPENILKKGYTLTLKDNKIVKHAEELKAGDTITTMFADGRKGSVVK